VAPLHSLTPHVDLPVRSAAKSTEGMRFHIRNALLPGTPIQGFGVARTLMIVQGNQSLDRSKSARRPEGPASYAPNRNISARHHTTPSLFIQNHYMQPPQVLR